jgi:hypothetical protein
LSTAAGGHRKPTWAERAGDGLNARV